MPTEWDWKGLLTSSESTASVPACARLDAIHADFREQIRATCSGCTGDGSRCLVEELLQAAMNGTQGGAAGPN